LAARWLDGADVAKQIRAEVAAGVADLVAQGKTRPRLAVVLAGDDLASQVYVRNKLKACQEAGIDSELIRLEGSRDEGRTLAAVNSLNRQHEVDGILVQLPLPADADKREILQTIDPAKDVDGLHPLNTGRLVLGAEGFRPCTPSGIMELLKRSEVTVAGAHAVILGRSDIVGKPLAFLLLQSDATVTVCHSKTRDLPAVASQADILVAAIGKPGFVTDAFVRPGATVVDVGVHRVQAEEGVKEFFGVDSPQWKAFHEGRPVMVGDVHPRRVQPVAGALSPVPGGVGPLTIACLLQNTLKAARLRRGLPG
jgi:methylenetetrahydrofolate dehydrogenase (NADP+) / methenyltetrahydrofolate cyclohydrolase